jgi:hypothetical protein
MDRVGKVDDYVLVRMPDGSSTISGSSLFLCDNVCPKCGAELVLTEDVKSKIRKRFVNVDIASCKNGCKITHPSLKKFNKIDKTKRR